MLVADHVSLSSGIRGNHHAAVRVAARALAAQLSLRVVRRTQAMSESEGAAGAEQYQRGDTAVADHASLSSGMRGNRRATIRVVARPPAAQLNGRAVRRTQGVERERENCRCNTNHLQLRK
jgi:hypothetical protein